MTYADFVKARFTKRHLGTEGLMHAAIGISGEAGELLDEIKKTWVYGKPLDRAKVIEELGDLEWYCEAMRQSLGITRDEVIAANVAKLEVRYPVAYSDELALARLDKA
jgi:NTP pyrophosphatase (non-canonical NTP hydrolase)